MPLITNLKNKLNEKNKISTSKKVGIVLLIIATIGYVGLFVKAIPFFHNFLLGTFGLFGYVLFLLMYIIGAGLVNGAKYVYSKKYIVYLCLALLSVLAIFHVAFTWNMELLSYGSYLSEIYSSGVSVGGLLLGLLIYPLQKFLFPIGAIFLFLISLAISIWLIYDYLTRVRYLKKADTKIFTQKLESNRQKGSSIISFETKRENNKIGLDAEIENEQKKREETLKKLGLEQNVKDGRFVENEKLSSIASDFINDKKPKIEKPTSFKGTFGYIEPTYTKSTKKQPTNYDKNLDFLNMTLNGANYISNSSSKEQSMDIIDSNDIKKQGKELSAQDFLNINFSGSKEAEKEYQKKSETNPYNNTYSNDYNNVNTDINAYPTNFNTNQNFEEEKQNDTASNENVLNDGFENNLKTEQETFDEKIFENVKSKQDFETEKDLNNIDEEIDLKNFELPAKLKLSSDTRRGNLNKLSSNQGSLFNNKLNTEEQPEKKPHIFKKYVCPTIDLLNTVSADPSVYNENCEENARAIESTLESFSIPAKVINTTIGPAVTRYELDMPAGISVNVVSKYQNDLSAAVASQKSVRIQAPIPGTSSVGVEVPNKKVATVGIREIIDSKEFLVNKNALSFAVGKEISGKCVVADMHDMPHMLVAGSTGSGKSVALNSLIVSLLYKYGPEDLRFIMVDPKQVEFSSYNGIPHLLTPEAITDPAKSLSALDWAINEMERRYGLLKDSGVKEILEYNELPEVKDKIKEKLYHIIIIIDEVGDIMSIPSVKRDFEDRIRRLAAKARAIGIYLILATQRPSVDVITGVIKANLPSRMAFAVQNFQDSRTILDCMGAEKLLGRGDMLFSPRGVEPYRVQGCYVSTQEINRIVQFIKQNNESYYDEEIEKAINKNDEEELQSDEEVVENPNGFDPLMIECLKLVIKNGCASTSMLQRRFAIGNPKAARIIDKMEEAKFIGPMNGSKPRVVYITAEQFKERFGESIDD